jgi:hypothetical protein
MLIFHFLLVENQLSAVQLYRNIKLEWPTSRSVQLSIGNVAVTLQPTN